MTTERTAPTAKSYERLRQERDFYFGLLQLGKKRELEPFLGDALRLAVELTGAARGYIELSIDGPDGDPRSWSIGHALTPDSLEEIRKRVSRGIIGEALATGATVLTPSAVLDERFAELESVRVGNIRAVLCAPVGSDPPLGVLYLEGRDAGTFDEECRLRAELLGEHLAPVAERLLMHRLGKPDIDKTLALKRKLRCEEFVGQSRAFARVLEQAALVAPLDVHVLLTGGSGTGKTQLARIIHSNSPRVAGPFVEVNSAALPETLVENELFGAAPGGHSSAHSAVTGKITAAEHGTLFLDDISELPLAAQAKLLQFLQSKQFYRLGSSRPTQADVRVIAATNVDLRTAVAERRFREDLFYRLEVLPIRLPSLAERESDVDLLLEYFCNAAVHRHGLPALDISPGARRAVRASAWPGNVRQLQHAVEAAAIRAAGSAAYAIEPKHFLADEGPDDQVSDKAETFQEATRRFQEDLLRHTLTSSDWNVADCARRLGLARSHVYSLIRAFGVERE